MGTITIGIDLAKQVFSTCEMDAGGCVIRRRELGRMAFGTWLAQQPAGRVVAMEACSGAHHWARECLVYGLVPRMMAAQFVKPFRKQRSGKNDRNDAEAIATAARQGNMRFVPVKSVEQQARLSWHRVREGYKADALAASNRLRGLLAEFGMVIAKGNAPLRRALGDADLRAGLPVMLLEALDGLAAHWRQLQERLAECDVRIDRHARLDSRCVQARQILGVGAITADALVAQIGDGREFRNGRQLSAWIGLVPSQHSTGGRQRLGAISRDGDAYLRTLLIQGARSSLQRANAVTREKANAEQLWIKSLAARLPFGKVLVAIANKHARQLWAMLARGEDYDPEAWLRHPMVQRPASAKRRQAEAA